MRDTITEYCYRSTSGKRPADVNFYIPQGKRALHRPASETSVTSADGELSPQAESSDDDLSPTDDDHSELKTWLEMHMPTYLDDNENITLGFLFEQLQGRDVNDRIRYISENTAHWNQSLAQTMPLATVDAATLAQILKAMSLPPGRRQVRRVR